MKCTQGVFDGVVVGNAQALADPLQSPPNAPENRVLPGWGLPPLGLLSGLLVASSRHAVRIRGGCPFPLVGGQAQGGQIAPGHCARVGWKA